MPIRQLRSNGYMHWKTQTTKVHIKIDYLNYLIYITLSLDHFPLTMFIIPSLYCSISSKSQS